MKRGVLFSGLFLLLFFPSQAAERQMSGWASLYEPSKFKDLPYRLMKPVNMESGKKYPLIISLHGAGGRGDDNKKQLKKWNQQLTEEKIRNVFPCYVLAPQSKGLLFSTGLFQTS